MMAPKFDGVWCKGGTTGFDPVGLGSTPSAPAKPGSYNGSTLALQARGVGSIPSLGTKR